MVRARWDDDELDDDELNDDYPDDDETLELAPCPHCGEQVYEEVQRCPACGAYITHATNVWLGRPWWWVVLGALGIGGAILAIVLGT